ncbi:hypothetical protein H5410_021484 [Solanum commersonii]|uniref:Uncharacterized protein n=1 Tax=Solanum commersonii TaxID=4109 RepID=A0A9J5ZB54_SOLCO|nr:hypothetical protein H5410_021484 [Solanum commersonii]
MVTGRDRERKCCREVLAFAGKERRRPEFLAFAGNEREEKKKTKAVAGRLQVTQRWQQLLINRLVGYDTILMNSLLNSPGEGIKYSRPQQPFVCLSALTLVTAYPEVLCSAAIFHYGHITV